MRNAFLQYIPHTRHHNVAGLRRRGCSRLLTILLVESLHASCGVDQLLLARKERMAGRANFHVKVAGS